MAAGVMPRVGLREALDQARAWMQLATQRLGEQMPADPIEIAALRDQLHVIEEHAGWIGAQIVAGKGGALTVTSVDATGRVRVVG